MAKISFDLDMLRSFVLGLDLGSLARAAERRGRSTSAISAQLKKLEEQAGTELLRRHGRGLVTTDAGELLLGYARRMLALNDEAALALQAPSLSGAVRLGLAEDFGEHLLPQVLGRFARAHPQIHIETRIGRHHDLQQRLSSGQLDLALTWDGGHETGYHEPLPAWPLYWIGPAHRACFDRREPLPLVMLDTPCLLRTAATAALDKAGIDWRIAFTSASLAGIWAAVGAGLGMTLRAAVQLPTPVAVLDDAAALGLPALAPLGLQLHRNEDQPSPAVLALAQLLRQGLEEARQAQLSRTTLA